MRNKESIFFYVVGFVIVEYIILKQLLTEGFVGIRSYGNALIGIIFLIEIIYIIYDKYIKKGK